MIFLNFLEESAGFLPRRLEILLRMVMQHIVDQHQYASLSCCLTRLGAIDRLSSQGAGRWFQYPLIISDNELSKNDTYAGAADRRAWGTGNARAARAPIRVCGAGLSRKPLRPVSTGQLPRFPAKAGLHPSRQLSFRPCPHKGPLQHGCRSTDAWTVPCPWL